MNSELLQVPDLALRTALNEILKQPADAPIALARAATFTTLGLQRTDVAESSALAGLTNLISLDLRGWGCGECVFVVRA